MTIEERLEFDSLDELERDLYIKAMEEHPHWNHKQRICKAVVDAKINYVV